jgi:hypothetical protein
MEEAVRQTEPQTTWDAYTVTCVGLLAPMWRIAGIHEHYPCSSATVVELLVKNEFDISHDLLTQYLTDRVVPSPENIGGNLSWDASKIWLLVKALDFRRRWKKFSYIHRAKRSEYEKLQELAELNEYSTCFADLDLWDIGALLGLLHEPGCDLGARQAIANALKQKLQQRGIEV